MHFNRFNKTMAGILVMTMVVSMASQTVTIHAANTTQVTTQSSEPPAGGPGGQPPPEGAPTGQPPENGQQPPEGVPTGQPPENGQQPPDGAPAGQTQQGEEKTQGQQPSDMNQAPPGGVGGADTMTFDYKGSYTAALVADGKEVSSDKESITASDPDQNAALVQNGGTLTITEGTLQKSGDDTNGDNCNFYGLNSILLGVNSDSKAYISGSSLKADSEGSNGIFSTDNAVIYANDNQISTSAGNSRGLDATYGGTIIANLMDISTKGDHSAAIATDRGGGTISVTNSTLSTEGSGSPLLYSTGNIEVDNVTGSSTGSQIAGMEGLNTIRIYHSSLTSANTGKTASDPVANGIIIYQSTSGDAEASTGEAATFEAADSTLKSAVKSGSMFYSTNTEANIVLSNTKLDFDSDNAGLLTVEGNDSNNWGTAGSNGSKVKFTGLNQTLNGTISVDTISSLELYLLENTTYTGSTVIQTNSVNTKTTESPVTVNLDSTSKWVLVKDCEISNLNAEKGASIVDEDGKTVTIVANGKTVVTGTGSRTLTVTGTYTETITTDTSNALSTSYSDRSEFDKYYGISTTFGENSAAKAGKAETSAESQSETESQAGNQEETSQNSPGGILAVIASVCAIIGVGGVLAYRKKRK